MSAPLLWGPNNTSNNLQNQVLLANGELLANNGPRNYITYGNFENGLTTGWSLSHTTLSSNIPNQASGSWTSANANLSTAIVSSGQLSGTYSLSLASSSATTAGDMLVSQAYTLNIQDQGKVLTGTFYYSAVTNSSNNNFSNSVSNTWQPYIYDVTNSAWIQPIGVYGINQGTGVGLSNIQWQVPSNCTSFRIAIVCINASAGATTLYFDNFTMGPSPYVYGSPITDWQSYTPTTQGLGTVSAVSVWYRRNGDSVEIIGKLTTGTVTATEMRIGLPSGLTIDSTKAAGIRVVGNFVRSSSYTTPFYLMATGGNTYLNYSLGNGPIFTVQTGSAAINSSDIISFTALVPVQGWSSNVQMSDTAYPNVVSTKVYISTGASIGANSKIPFDRVVYDVTGSFNTSTNTFTVPSPGYYKVFGTLQTSSTSSNIKVYRNGATWNDGPSNNYIMSLTGIQSGSTEGYCNAGDTLYIFSDSAFTIGNTNSYIIFEKLTGPTTIGASEKVFASYTATANGTVTATQQVNFDTRLYDSHGSVTTGSGWKFTSPRAGFYTVLTTLSFTTVGTPVLWKNDAAYITMSVISRTPNDKSTIGTQLYLNASDWIYIRSDVSLTYNGGAYNSTYGYNSTITILGN